MSIKAFIYQRTGIYLAHKEENDYITSKVFWKEFMRIAGKKTNDMRPRDIQGLLIGMWQCEQGFARPRCTTWKEKVKVFVFGF